MEIAASSSCIGTKTANSLVDPTLIDQARKILQQCRDLSIDVLRKHIPSILDDCPRSVTRQPFFIVRACYCRRMSWPSPSSVHVVVPLWASPRRATFRRVISSRVYDRQRSRSRNRCGRSSSCTAGRRPNFGGTGQRSPRHLSPEHKELAAEIAQQGALLSEMPIDQRPLPGCFRSEIELSAGCVWASS